MWQGNDLFRAARLARQSPYRPGQTLSTIELGDAVRDHIYRETGRIRRVSGPYVGAVERGERRWPHEAYRAGFRAVLGVGTDDELGFYDDAAQRRAAADAYRVHSDRLPRLGGSPAPSTAVTAPVHILVSPRATAYGAADLSRLTGPAVVTVSVGTVRIAVGAGTPAVTSHPDLAGLPRIGAGFAQAGA